MACGGLLGIMIAMLGHHVMSHKERQRSIKKALEQEPWKTKLQRMRSASQLLVSKVND